MLAMREKRDSFSEIDIAYKELGWIPAQQWVHPRYLCEETKAHFDAG